MNEGSQKLLDALAPLLSKLSTWVDTSVGMLPNLVVAVLVLLLFWWLGSVAHRLVRSAVARVSDNDHIAPLAGIAGRSVVFGAGVFLALTVLHLGKAVTSLLAGLGVLGVALGFALQEIASNFVSGVVLAAREPFRVGDVLTTKGVTGRVEAMHLRTTTILALDGDLVMVPNKQLFAEPLINHSRSGRHRVSVEVGIAYGDDLEEALDILESCIEDVDHIEDQPVEVFATEFGSSSINLLGRFWVDFASPADERQARSEAIRTIKKRFDESGITIPFPIRTLEMGSDEQDVLAQLAAK